MKDRTCFKCGAAFVGRASKRYCSAGCKKATEAAREARRVRARNRPTCARCGSSREGTGHPSYCRDCWNSYRRAYRKRMKTRPSAKCARCGKIRTEADLQHPSYCQPCQRIYYREVTHGVTQEMFDAMLASQDSRCAICRRKQPHGRALHIDHCHETGRVRGLLCEQCNMGLGHFQDDVAALRRAAEYLELLRCISPPTNSSLAS